MKRIKTIDIIKGIAIIMVILVHFTQSFSALAKPFYFFRFGQMGCQLFFVASGFCVAASYNKINCASSDKAVLTFYRNRLKAIAPAYYIMILVVFLCNSFLLAFTGKTMNFGTNRSFIGIVSNVLFINGLIPAHNNNVMVGSWYIGTTMLMYLLLPFIYKIFKRNSNKKFICFAISIISLTVFLVITLIFQKYEDILLPNNSFGYFFILNQLPCFCIGVLLFWEYSTEAEHFILKFAHLIYGLISLFAAIVLFFSFDHIRYIFSIVPLLTGIAVYFFLRYFIAYELLRDIGDRWTCLLQKLGNKSYYMYLTHGFFVWTMPQFIRLMLESLHVQINSNLLFLILAPFAFLFTYIAAIILERITRVLTCRVFNTRFC